MNSEGLVFYHKTLFEHITRQLTRSFQIFVEILPFIHYFDEAQVYVNITSFCLKCRRKHSYNKEMYLIS